MNITHLGNCDAAFLSQLLFSLLAGIRVAEVRVEILVQNFCCLLAEVSPFSPDRGGKTGERQSRPINGRPALPRPFGECESHNQSHT